MDEALIILCKSGDNKAQRALYDQISGKMFRVCLRYLQNQMDAEDALVTGFLKVFNCLSKMEYRNKEATEAWIKKIMVNECLMALRKKKTFFFSLGEVDNSMEVSEFPADILEAEEIYAMIIKLPMGYRTVFNLYVIEGYNHKEIAMHLNISENTSKSQLRKARIALQEAIKLSGSTK